MQVRQPQSSKICSRIQISFGFWGHAVKAYDFFRKLAWLSRNFFWKFCLMDLSSRFSKVEIWTKLLHKQIAGVNPGGISQSVRHFSQCFHTHWRCVIHLLIIMCDLNFSTNEMAVLLLLWVCKGAGPFSTPDLWMSFSINWNILSGFTKELYIADWCDSVRWYDLCVYGFSTDIRSVITLCPHHSLTVRYQQPFFTLFTYLSCRHLSSYISKSFSCLITSSFYYIISFCRVWFYQ